MNARISMTPRIRRLFALLASIAILAAACDSPLSTEEYAGSIGPLTDAYVVESQNLSYDYQSSVEDGVRTLVDEAGDDAATQAVVLIANESVQYLALLGDSMDRYVVSLRKLSPPAPLANKHDAYVSAIVFVHEALPETRDAVAAAEDIASIQLALTSSGFADGQIRWTAACASLEDAIRSEGRGVDLRCVRPDVTP
jgi:hypothetical protein